MDPVLGTVTRPADAWPEQARSCAVLPAYNAALHIGPLVRAVRRLGLDAIVIDDGSTDATARQAAGAGARVVSHARNLGKGRALRTGFAQALRDGYTRVVTMDSDGQHDPADIPRLLEAAETALVVIGDRRIDRHRMPPARRATNRLMSAIVSRVAGQSIPDTQCGFRCLHRSALERFSLTTDRYELETELLLQAAAAGCRIASVPVRTIYQEQVSGIRPLPDAWRFLRLLARHVSAGRRLSPARSAHGL
jgi:glycosyltransferase involved in cell wall biosynthesis